MVRKSDVPPLIAAVNAGSLDRVNQLIAGGAELNTRAEGSDWEVRGDTALHLALGQEGPQAGEIVRALVNAGAALHLKDRAGDRPLDIGRRAGRKELVRWIEKNAARVGPPSLRRARREKIARIIVYYDKADGLAFDPNNVDRPLMTGGDYMGMFTIDAGAALGDDHEMRRIRLRGGAWTIPIIERLARDGTLDMDALLAKKRRVAIEHGEVM